jgi:hypothetical protein
MTVFFVFTELRREVICWCWWNCWPSLLNICVSYNRMLENSGVGLHKLHCSLYYYINWPCSEVYMYVYRITAGVTNDTNIDVSTAVSLVARAVTLVITCMEPLKTDVSDTGDSTCQDLQNWRY